LALDGAVDAAGFRFASAQRAKAKNLGVV